VSLVHSVTIADGTADLTLSWSPDGATAISEGDGGQNRLELSREDIFALSQWAGTALNHVHFGLDMSEDD
jgi:hypothetical protein